MCYGDLKSKCFAIKFKCVVGDPDRYWSIGSKWCCTLYLVSIHWYILLEYLTLVHHTRKILGIYSYLDTQVHTVYSHCNSPSKCRLYSIVHSAIGPSNTLYILRVRQYRSILVISIKHISDRFMNGQVYSPLYCSSTYSLKETSNKSLY